MGKPRSDDVYVALMRGINVGGNNKLPMKELIQIFEACGAKDVKTYIQSGNVFYRATTSVAGKIVDSVRTQITRVFGYDLLIVVRPLPAIDKVIQRNPFVDDADDPKQLHVAFLENRPKKADIDNIDLDRSGPARFEVVGSEIFLYCPDGLSKTNFTNVYFDRKLKTVSTMRNWRTTNKLLEIGTTLKTGTQ